MRMQGGSKLLNQEWQALLATEINIPNLEDDPEAFLKETAGWFESCYLWSVVSMASYSRATISARENKQVLFYCQAVDYSPQLLASKDDFDIYDRMLAVPNVNNTSRLPGWALLHIGMRVRLTTQVLTPWAVQDSCGTVMEIDLSANDRRRFTASVGERPAAEMCLNELPNGVYVHVDKCNHEFLPPLACLEHEQSGFSENCSVCRSFEGWVLVEPLKNLDLHRSCHGSYRHSSSDATAPHARGGVSALFVAGSHVRPGPDRSFLPCPSARTPT